MIHISFDHIKTLPDGNYGCTLKVGGKSYCAIYTSDWQVIEPLHEVEQDPYSDYTYIRDKDFAVASSYLYNGEHHQIDPQLLYVLGIGNHELENPDINIDIEDYIWEENTNKDTTLLFTVQYLDKDGNMAFVLNDTLAPYSIFAPAVLESVYGRFDMLYCNFTRTIDFFDIETDTTNPKDKALRGLLDWFDLVYSTIDDFCQKNRDRKPFKKLMLGVARANIEAIELYGSFQLGLVEFPRLVYLEYLKLAN